MAMMTNLEMTVRGTMVRSEVCQLLVHRHRREIRKDYRVVVGWFQEMLKAGRHDLSFN